MSAKPSGITNKGVIPGSIRPDGSKRPEIKVRPGFVPAEDQIAFQSKRVVQQVNTIPGTSRPRVNPNNNTAKPPSKPTNKPSKKTVPPAVVLVEEDTGSKESLEKKLRGVTKKLRQIMELEAKRQDGFEIDAGQLEKLKGKAAIEAEKLDLEEQLKDL